MKGNITLVLRYLFTAIFNGAAAGILVATVTAIIIVVFNLSTKLVLPIAIIVGILIVVLLSIKPAWALRTTGYLIFLIGVLLIFLSQNEELYRQITWNPSMLGAGASIVALGITFLTLLKPRETKEETKGLPSISTIPPNSKENVETPKYAYWIIGVVCLVSIIQMLTGKKAKDKKQER